MPEYITKKQYSNMYKDKGFLCQPKKGSTLTLFWLDVIIKVHQCILYFFLLRNIGLSDFP